MLTALTTISPSLLHFTIIFNFCYDPSISIQISDHDGGSWLFVMNMWFYGFFLKLLPCLVLTVFTASLIHAMYQVRRVKNIMDRLLMLTIFCRLRRSPQD